MELNKSFFSITPEAFKTINVYFTGCKQFTMINPQMSITAKHKRIIAFKFISVNNRATPNGFNCHIKYRLSCNIFNNITPYYPVSLKNTEHWNLIPVASTTFTLASATKVCLIKLYLTTKKIMGILIACYYSSSNNGYSFMYRWVTQINLLCYLSCRYFKLKEFDYPEPLLIWYFNLINPSITKIMKCISATFTTIFFTYNPIYFTSRTSCTKNKAIFPTVFLEIQPRLILCLPYYFKRVYVHLTLLYLLLFSVKSFIITLLYNTILKKGGVMKYRKWDSKTKAKIVLEGLQNKISLAGLCNQPDKVVLAGRHQITQSQYYYWLNEFQAKSYPP